MRRSIRLTLDSAGYCEQFAITWCDLPGEAVECEVSPTLAFGTTPENALAEALSAQLVQDRLPGC